MVQSTPRSSWTRWFLLSIALLILIPGCSSSQEQDQPYKDTWDSLSKHSFPEWLHDAKFGIWTHWGPYAVPAYKHEWYPRRLFTKKDFRRYHEKTYGPLEEVGYHDLIPKFTADQFDADRWAKLFNEAGARFAGPVAEHHDGFAMYESKYTQWDASEKGPKQDILKALAQSIRTQDMKFVTSFHHLRKWEYYEPSYTEDDRYNTENPKYAGLDGLYPPPHEKEAPAPKSYFSMSMGKVREVVDRYRPSLLFFDSGPGGERVKWEEGAYEPLFRETVAEYYNQARDWGEEVSIIAESEDLPGDLTGKVGILTLEREKMETAQEKPWMMITSVDDIAWSHIQNPDYKSSDALVQLLVDVISKNGVLWLNIGPKADGTIPAPQKKRLRAMGDWLERNGEAVYGTRPWRTPGSGSIRYTTKGDTLYAVSFTKPTDGLTLEALTSEEASSVESVALLGAEGSPEWSATDDGLTIQWPDGAADQLAYAFKVTLPMD
ncbi:MAG: alpha-L-fucosidase [Salinibacter sp.]